MGPWNNEALVSELAELCKTMSMQEVTNELNAKYGLTLSRNSVIGKLHRMGIKLKDKPANKPRLKPASKPALKIIPSIKTTTEAVEAPRCVEIEPLNLTLLELERGQCRFPYGDRDFVFCGHPVQPGSSYCTAHHALTRVVTLYRRAA